MSTNQNSVQNALFEQNCDYNTYTCSQLQVYNYCITWNICWYHLGYTKCTVLKIIVSIVLKLCLTAIYILESYIDVHHFWSQVNQFLHINKNISINFPVYNYRL